MKIYLTVLSIANKKIVPETKPLEMHYSHQTTKGQMNRICSTLRSVFFGQANGPPHSLVIVKYTKNVLVSYTETFDDKLWMWEGW